MEKLLEDKISPALVGLYQAAGVILYTILIATLFASVGNFEAELPQFVVMPIMLSLLVLSAGLTGTLVFGLPVYFTFAKNNVKRAINILAYTFLYLLTTVLVAFLIVLTFFQKA